MEEAQVLIVGGGVVGCAIACELSAHWQDVFLLEQFPKLGTLTSSRNSAVIHSGVFSPPRSLKAKHCVAGNRATFEFCRRHEIPFRNTGKLVLAQSADDEAALHALLRQGEENGVSGLEIVPRKFIREQEPFLRGDCAIWVPSAGIVDNEALVRGYARIAARQGASIVTGAKLLRAEPEQSGIRVETTRGPFTTRILVNSAGLFADEIARMLGFPDAQIYPCRGEYCEIRKSRWDLVQGLVYPIPDRTGHGIGVHLTKTVTGNILVGPNARYIQDKNDYERNREPVETFYELARRMLPGLELSDLTLGYSGIRPKLWPADRKGAADFVIERDPLYPAAIHLLGIESPGLTAAPSIARQVSELVQEALG